MERFDVLSSYFATRLRAKRKTDLRQMNEDGKDLGKEPLVSDDLCHSTWVVAPCLFVGIIVMIRSQKAKTSTTGVFPFETSDHHYPSFCDSSFDSSVRFSIGFCLKSKNSIWFDFSKNLGRFFSIQFLVATVTKPLLLSWNWDIAWLSSSICWEIVWFNNINKEIQIIL